MAPVKKLFPKLYPSSRKLDQKWFVKYYERDYNSGKLLAKKYIGILNKLPSVDARLEEFNAICRLMSRGEELPDYQGMKSIPIEVKPRNFASTNTLCQEFVEKFRMNGKQKSAQGRKSHIKLFSEWLHKSGNADVAVGQFGVKEAMDYILHMKGKRHAPSYIRKAHSYLHQCWEYFANCNYIQQNVWKRVKPPAREYVSFKRYTPELEALIAKYLPQSDPQLWVANQLCYYTFLRETTMQQLKCESFNWTDGTLHIPKSILKGKKDRVIVLPVEMIEILISHGYHLANPSDYVFTNKRCPGKVPVGKNYFANQFRKFRERHRIHSSYKFYAGKHTGNDKLRSTGVDIVALQMHNGHSSLDHTQHYNTDVTTEQLRHLHTGFPKFAKPVKRPSKINITALIDEMMQRHHT